MDRWVSVAFNVVIGIFEDKPQLKKARKVLLKVFRLTLQNFGSDEEFQKVMRLYVMKPED